MSQDGFHVGVVGATGAVGREMVKTLEERDFPIASLRLLASPRSAGQEMTFRGETITVEVAQPDSFEGMQIALFSAGGGTSKELAPEAWARGCLVIDNSSAWRMDPDCPLVVPEVNPDALEMYERKGIIGNPNCSTIQMVVPLRPIHDRFGIKRIVVSTYQAASGAGQKAMTELGEQTVSTLNMEPVEPKNFPHQLAFNLLPHIDVFMEDGYTKEDHKMINETRKILDLPDLEVFPTCVRVPIFSCHAESVMIETEEPITVEEVRALLTDFPGVEVQDDPASALYPMPLNASDTDPVFVGRIRQLPGDTHRVSMWIVADNLRKGAALNAVQIAELMIAEYL